MTGISRFRADLYPHKISGIFQAALPVRPGGSQPGVANHSDEYLAISHDPVQMSAEIDSQRNRIDVLEDTRSSKLL